jgi:hypothetical protein
MVSTFLSKCPRTKKLAVSVAINATPPPINSIKYLFSQNLFLKKQRDMNETVSIEIMNINMI